MLIELEDGSVIDSGCVEGEVYNDWSREEVEANVRWLAEDILTEPCIDRLIRMARELDSSKDVRALTEEMSGGARRATEVVPGVSVARRGNNKDPGL